jgi:hypothetical protein
MKIYELLESAGIDEVDQLTWNIHHLIPLYRATLPAILKEYDLMVSDPSDSVELELVKKHLAACSLRLASVRSKWFTDNFMSVSKRRFDTSDQMSRSGLQTPLQRLAKMPQFQRVDGLHGLANLSLNMSAKVREKEKTTYGKLMLEIEDNLPTVALRIAKVTNDTDLAQAATDLKRYIAQWESMKAAATNITKDMNSGISLKKQGDAYISSPNKDYHRNSDMVKSAPKPVDNSGQQNAQVQDLIQTVLSQIEPSIAKIVGPKINKVPIEGRLAALRAELAKHGKQMESMFK